MYFKLPVIEAQKDWPQRAFHVSVVLLHQQKNCGNWSSCAGKSNHALKDKWKFCTLHKYRWQAMVGHNTQAKGNFDSSKNEKLAFNSVNTICKWFKLLYLCFGKNLEVSAVGSYRSTAMHLPAFSLALITSAVSGDTSCLPANNWWSW